ncbi:hypothetical protein EV426DRAFT_645012 [Tirmania nivea]|nr:hypothetical protein EV426DRAFT_645012 [Tirmania nivea]
MYQISTQIRLPSLCTDCPAAPANSPLAQQPAQQPQLPRPQANPTPDLQLGSLSIIYLKMPRPTKQKRACRAATLASQIARQRENHTELELLELEDLEEDVLEVQENMEEDQLEALDEEYVVVVEIENFVGPRIWRISGWLQRAGTICNTALLRTSI